MLRRFWLNSVAASPVWSGRVRSVLLRFAGIYCTQVEIRHGLVVNGDATVRIGRFSFVNTGVLIDAVAPVTLGAGVALGHRVALLTSTHSVAGPERRWGGLVAEAIVIGDGTWIGAGAVILPGVSVGAGCIVAAAAVVTADCAPNGLYVGVPARRVRDLSNAEVFDPSSILAVK